MNLYCDMSDCVHCLGLKCQLDSLTLHDLTCETYQDIHDTKEYHETYFTANSRDFGNGKVNFRLEKLGKRVELDGIVAYTSQDVREGYAGAYFTEKRTGILIPIDKMAVDPKTKELVISKLKEYPDVMSMPLYRLNEHGEPEPVTFGAVT